MDVLWHLPATNILRLMDLEADRSIERRRRVESSSDDLMRHLVITIPLHIFSDH
jgi:hypothetical protein